MSNYNKKFNILEYLKRKQYLEYIRKAKSSIIQAFASNNDASMRVLLQEDMSRYIPDFNENKNKYVLITDNIFLEIIQAISTLYQESPEISISKQGGTIDKDNTDLLSDLLNRVDYFSYMQNLQVLQKSHNTVLSQIVVDKELEYISLVERTPNFATVITNNQIKTLPEIILYEIATENYENYETEKMFIGYDKNRIITYKVDMINGLSQYIPIKEIENPFKFLPFMVYRQKRDTSDFWGQAEDSLANYCRAYNLFLTLLFDDSTLLSSTLKWVGTQAPKNLRIGLRHLVNLYRKNVKAGEPPPSLDASYIEPNFSQLTIKTEYVNWIVKNIKQRYKLPKHLIEYRIEAQSGYAMEIESRSLISLHNKDKQINKNPDIETLAKLIHINNYYAQDLDLPVIKVNGATEYYNIDKSLLSIRYKDLNFPKSHKEISEYLDWLVSKGYISPIDAMRRVRPEMLDKSDEELEAILDRNLGGRSKVANADLTNLFREEE